MDVNQAWQTRPVAVLVSGGLDSAILVGELARTCPQVHPVYVRFGLIWEDAEERAVRRFLEELSATTVAPLTVFHLPVNEIYGEHWSATGNGTPHLESADSEVFLPGRTLLLLSQPAVWCHLRQISTIALGVLQGNPFPDSTEDFLRDYERLMNTALSGSLQFIAPFRKLTKREVLVRGRHLPLGATMSCLQPRGDLHCGTCNKCGERKRAFASAEIADPTRYAE